MLFLRSLLFTTCAAIVAATPLPAPTALATLVAGAETVSESAPTSVPTGYFTSTKLVTIPGVTNSHVTIPAKTITIAVPTCVQTIEPDENGHVPAGTCGAIWNYYPGFAAALALAFMFGMLLVAHIWQAAKFKKAWCWVIIMATVWETLAFAFRALSSKFQQSSGIYLVFQIFILLAPLWVNAFIYMTFGRMLHYYHPSQSIFNIPASTFAAIFVGLDIVASVVQVVGGTLANPRSTPDEQSRAIHLYMGGIGLQEFFIVLFVGLCVVFQRQISAIERRSSWFSWLTATEWGPLLCAVYVSLLMISVRIIYRLIEFSGGMGENNSLTSHESYFYALEAAPMFFAIIAFNIVHPGRYLTGPKSVMPGLFTTIKSKIMRRKGTTLIVDDSSDEQSLFPKRVTSKDIMMSELPGTETDYRGH